MGRRSLLLAAGTTALLAGGTAALPARAANYALVVGINEYATQADLSGASNDARLIASALTRFGVSDLRLLLDAAATRAAVEGAWNELLAKAGEGDTVVFAYSGHGGMTEDLDGDEATPAQPDDRLDETFLLTGYGGDARDERIVDDELHTWFLAAREKGVRVVLVADSCYSGTVTRGGRARLGDDYITTGTPDRKPVQAMASNAEDTLDNVVFLAGSREAETVVEVPIEGRYHGALSYAFARALGMNADLDGDGTLGRDDLGTFIPRTAHSFNEGRYLPEINPRTGPDFAVLAPDPAAAAAAAEADEEPEDAGVGLVPVAAASIDRIELEAAPGMVWDRRTGDITDAMAQVVAHAVPEDRLGEVNDKFRLLGLAREGMVRRGLTVQALVDGRPSYDTLSEGTRFELAFGPLPQRYLTVFNLANTGEVQLVYPVDAGERGPRRTGELVTIGAEVAPPFGSDHMIAIASAEEPVDLRTYLGWSMPAAEFVPVLTRLLAADDVAFGSFSLITKELP